MQDPATRVYDPQNHWGNGYDQRDHICYVSGKVFVRARCEQCFICPCRGDYEKVELKPCADCFHCNKCYNLTAHGHAIVVATDGACRNNGRPNAVAACGIFFNVDSPHNKAFQIRDRPSTSQRAELRAAIYALRALTKMFTAGHFRNKSYVTEVIIKSDSTYLVNGMTSWIVNWRTNGYMNSRGQHLRNKRLFRELDRLCNDLMMLGVQARSWHVSREDNQQADKLANAALDGTHWKGLSADEWFGNYMWRPQIH